MSQFIIITHNKKTVICAKTLLGVTMEESGISKMISARLGDTDAVYEPSAPQNELFEEEEVEKEEGRELPPGVNDPAKVSEEELRPIRSRNRGPINQ